MQQQITTPKTAVNFNSVRAALQVNTKTPLLPPAFAKRVEKFAEIYNQDIILEPEIAESEVLPVEPTGR